MDLAEKEYQKLEDAVLGAIILEPHSLELVSSDLMPKCFLSEANQHIYQAILDIKKDSGAIDYMTVLQKLKSKGLLETVGQATVIDLTNRIASASNIEYHARIIIERYLHRKIGEVCSYGLIKLNERGVDVFDVLDELKSRFDTSVNEVTGNKSFDTIDTLADSFLTEIESKKSGILPEALGTGLTEIDKFGGLNNSDLIYVGARPGMGKTAFAVTGLRNCALRLKKSCGIFSLEMTSSQLLTRIASAECKINGELLRTGKLTDVDVNRLYKRINEIRKAPLYIDDKARNLETILSKARNMKRKHKIELLVIDYLGLIRTKRSKDKNSEITEISAELKSLAKELNIPIICLSQLSRDIEKRPIDSRMPVLSDLRDSGSIEQDADQVIFLFRPEYYEIETLNIDGIETDIRGKGFIKYAKNRHGQLGTKEVGFRGEFTEFHNLFEPFEIEEEKPILQNNHDFLSQ